GAGDPIAGDEGARLQQASIPKCEGHVDLLVCGFRSILSRLSWLRQRFVRASEAKPSISERSQKNRKGRHRRTLDCFASLAMTVGGVSKLCLAALLGRRIGACGR